VHRETRIIGAQNVDVGILGNVLHIARELPWEYTAIPRNAQTYLCCSSPSKRDNKGDGASTRYREFRWRYIFACNRRIESHRSLPEDTSCGSVWQGRYEKFIKEPDERTLLFLISER
jgi:hypothetical protein